MYSLGNETYYGGFRNAQFYQVFDSFESFKESYETIGIAQTINQNSLANLWILLCGQYGESHIAYNSMNMFKQALFSIIFMYGPAWEKRLQLQNQLLELTPEQIRIGTKAIHNHAFAPGTPPSTATLEELTAIDSQNTSTYIKGELQAISELWELIETDVTAYFLNRFGKLFITVAAPDTALLYDVEELENNIRL